MKLAPLHGLTGYTTRGCRCEVCVQANRDYQAKWARDRRRGIAYMTSATETRRHLRKLMASGHSGGGIQSLTGLSDAALLRILAGKTKRVKISTEEAVLGVRLNELPDDGHLVSAKHAELLFRAMRERFSGRDIMLMLGYAPSSSYTVVPGMSRSRRITKRNHRRVVVLYELLARAGHVDAILLEGVPS